MSYFWLEEKEIPETLYHSWVSILIYNLAKKAFNLAGEKLSQQIKWVGFYDYFTSGKVSTNCFISVNTYDTTTLSPPGAVTTL